MLFCYFYTFKGSPAWFLMVHLDGEISKRVCTIRNMPLLDGLCNWGSLISKREPRATKVGKVKYWAGHSFLSTFSISSWFMFVMEWGWCLGVGVHGFIIFFSKSILEYCIHFQLGSIECTLYLSHCTLRGRLWVILFIGMWLAIPLHFLVCKGELKVGNKLDWLPMFVVCYCGFLLCFWVFFKMLVLWV